MTLLWLGLTLAVIVFGLVYLSWDVSRTYGDQVRAFHTSRLRFPAYSVEWAEFQAEVEARRFDLSAALESPDALSRLAVLLDEVRLEGVA